MALRETFGDLDANVVPGFANDNVFPNVQLSGSWGLRFVLQSVGARPYELCGLPIVTHLSCDALWPHISLNELVQFKTRIYPSRGGRRGSTELKIM